MTIDNVIKSTVKGNQQTISFYGDLTIFHAELFKKKIKRRPEQVDHIIIDLEQVEGLDCAGIQLLLSIAKSLRIDKLPAPSIVHGQQSEEVFELLNLDEYFYWEESQLLSDKEGVNDESRTSH